MFTIIEQFDVSEVYFIGSVASAIPHTRQPRVHASVATEAFKEKFEGTNVQFGSYSGPSSIITSMTLETADRGVPMCSLVAEIPHYPFLDLPTYPKSMLAMCVALNSVLDIEIDLETLYDATAQVERQLDETMQDNDEFEQLVRTLEEAYDRERSQGDEGLLKRLIDDIDLEGGQGPIE
jgi:proteasome assembly chaperone (PAC2) family protein